ncbi:hypothetical protein SSYIS1_00670 [Serratia symbiotica]|uniref:Uncharacterized protein n=1 Tax=Serratia symbiotica TaxID=138074 RepID=A0A455VDI1_9GAMM|nr:hypothetical protein SSYIS1_00670 [Serratia symbiotica]
MVGGVICCFLCAMPQLSDNVVVIDASANAEVDNLNLMMTS